MRALSSILVERFPLIKMEAGAGNARLYADGNGEQIVYWNQDELGPQPTAEQLAAWMAEPEPVLVPVVPASVRNSQVCQWLLDHGLYDVVLAKLNNPAAWPNEVERRKAVVRWDKEPNVNRNDPLVLALGADLGMDADALDAAFIEISVIP